MDGLISIIVPAYNVEQYIGKCLESILGQTYHNLEIILIDDGSTDSTGEICDAYGKRDSRVVVAHQKNQQAADDDADDEAHYAVDGPVWCFGRRHKAMNYISPTPAGTLWFTGA